ncbi:MAG: bifunctional nicotinamidase/pyrazinamidase [Treponema sp.]|jgi:nicotinamidase/pyrazinamidase|nr:bifunctional nicotinamidase/pyrazinamidase [Treponema sp.]
MKLDFSLSALLIIDVQNDFCPGGALAVEKGDEVIEPLNRLASMFAAESGRVVATQDWHPANHVSFAASHEGKKPGDMVDLPEVKEQVLWPKHCVQGTRGADFHKGLNLTPVNLIIRKGFRTGLDSYSAFFENDRKTFTGLDGYLTALSIDTVVIGGLATDYCVAYSAADAVNLGFKTIVALDACRGVGIPKGAVERALEYLEKKGVIMIQTGDIN